MRPKVSAEEPFDPDVRRQRKGRSQGAEGRMKGAGAEESGEAGAGRGGMRGMAGGHVRPETQPLPRLLGSRSISLLRLGGRGSRGADRTNKQPP